MAKKTYLFECFFFRWNLSKIPSRVEKMLVNRFNGSKCLNSRSILIEEFYKVMVSNIFKMILF